jgi:hypothetical protein
MNITKLTPAIKIISDWLTANGLEVQHSKLKLMHFMKGPDLTSPPLCLNSHQPIIAPKTVRWLRFHLDRHLNFTQHMKVMAACAMATIHTMGILGNTI